MEFRWNRWNVTHVARHGVTPEDAEEVVRSSRRPYPRKIDEDKWLVVGRQFGGRVLQVVFVEDEDNSLFVIHARPLTDKEKKRWRKTLHD